MAERLGNHLRMLALRDQDRRVGVPEVVEARLSQLRLLPSVTITMDRYSHPREVLKTAKSLRPVAMPKTLRDELEPWWKQSSHRGPDDYVFPSSTGTPLDARGMIRDVFEPAQAS